MSSDTLRSKVASGVFIEVEEVISPDLYNSLSVLGTISGVNGVNACLKNLIIFKITGL